ncbi:unnamed protein product [Closterium sp. NIES-53]
MDDSSVRLSLRRGASVAEISKRLESFFVNLEASLVRCPVGSATGGALPKTRDSQPLLPQTTSQAMGDGLRMRKVGVEAEAELHAAAELCKQTPLAELRTLPATAPAELRTADALSAATHLQSDVTEARIVLADDSRCPRLSELYEVGRELGRGHFGVVRLCEDRATGERFACKTILLSGVRVSRTKCLFCVLRFLLPPSLPPSPDLPHTRQTRYSFSAFLPTLVPLISPPQASAPPPPSPSECRTLASFPLSLHP